MSEGLRPCPFCAGAKVSYDLSEGCVSCLTCGADGPREPSLAEWNRRAEPVGEQRTEVYDGVRGLFCDADTVPDVVMVNGERFVPNSSPTEEEENDWVETVEADILVEQDGLVADAHSAGFEAGVLMFADPMPSGKNIAAEEWEAWKTYLAALRARSQS